MALPFECCLCEVSVLGLDTLRSHVAGKQHAVKAYRYAQGGLSRNHGPSAVRCVMCNVVLPNVEKVVEHLQSASAHQSPGDSAEGGKLWTCDVCEVTVSGTADNVNSHKAGKQHMAALGRRTVMAGVPGTLDGIPTPGTSDTPQVCRVCNVSINGEASMRQHLAGKQHASKVRLMQQVQQAAAIPVSGLAGSLEQIRCNTCNISVTSLENLEQHCSGRQHIVNLASSNNSGSSSPAVAKASPMSALGTLGKLAPAPLSVLGTPGKLAPAPLSALGTPGKLAPVPLSVLGTPSKPAPAAGAGGNYCSICNIYATSADGLQAHLDGKAHAKKLKTLGAGTERLSLLQSSASNVPSGATGPATVVTGTAAGVTGTATSVTGIPTGATGIPTGVTGTATGATGIPTAVTGTATGATGIPTGVTGTAIGATETHTGATETHTGATGIPTGVTGTAAGATGTPTGATGIPTGATGPPTAATVMPTAHPPGIPIGVTGAPTSATGISTGATATPTGATATPTGATATPTGATGTPTGATDTPMGATGTPTGATGILSVDNATLSVATSNIPSTLAGTTTVTLTSSGSDMPSSSKPLAESSCSKVVADDSNPLHCAVCKTGFATRDEMATHCGGREHMTSRMLAAMARNLNPAYGHVLTKRDDGAYDVLSKVDSPEGSGTQSVNPPSTAELLVDASMESSDNANNNESDSDDSDEDVTVQSMVEDAVFGSAESSLFSADKRRDCMERRKAYKTCRRQIKAQNKNQENPSNPAYSQYILADDEVRKLKEEISQQVCDSNLVCQKIIKESVAVLEDIGSTE